MNAIGVSTLGGDRMGPNVYRSWGQFRKRFVNPVRTNINIIVLSDCSSVETSVEDRRAHFGPKGFSADQRRLPKGGRSTADAIACRPVNPEAGAR